MTLEKFESILKVEGKSTETIRTYTKCVRQYLLWLKKRQPNKENVLAFLLKLVKNKDLKPSTKRMYATSLKIYFDKMELKFPKVKMPVVSWGKPKALTEEEYARLYKATKGDARARAMLSLAYSTGVRVGELVSRTRKDLDMRNPKKAKLMVAGKTGADTDAWLPVNDRAVEDLRAYLTSLPMTLGPDDYVFHGAAPQFAMHTNMAREILYKIEEKAGIDKQGFHVTRHSRATHLVAKGVPLPYIQGLLRHKDPKMTFRYTQPMTEDMRSEFDRVDKRRRRR